MLREARVRGARAHVDELQHPGGGRADELDAGAFAESSQAAGPAPASARAKGRPVWGQPVSPPTNPSRAGRARLAGRGGLGSAWSTAGACRSSRSGTSRSSPALPAAVRIDDTGDGSLNEPQLENHTARVYRVLWSLSDVAGGELRKPGPPPAPPPAKRPGAVRSWPGNVRISGPVAARAAWERLTGEIHDGDLGGC